VIAANRALLAALVATNFLGVNTPAIAATEATYAEFWAQDAGAMYGYAGAAGAASQLTPFTEAPATTNDSGQATQAASTAQSAAASSADSTSDILAFLTQLNTQLTTLNTDITGFASQLTTAETAFITSLGIPAVTLPPDLTGGLTSIGSLFTALNGSISTFLAGPFSPLGFTSGFIRSFYQASVSIPNLGVGIQGIGPLIHPTPITGALSPLLHSGLLSGSYTGAGSAETLASVGRAGYIGSLSVPQNWAAATPAIRTVAAEMEASALDAAPEMGLAQPGMFGQTALSSLAGRAIGGTATRAAVGQGFRVPGAVAVDEIATTATIIVIPPSAE
jgi:PPE-repeat protein